MSNRSVIESEVHISTRSVVLSFGQVVLKQLVLPVVLWVHTSLSTLSILFNHTEVLVQVLAVVTLDAATVIFEGSSPHTVGHQQEACQQLKHF